VDIEKLKLAAIEMTRDFNRARSDEVEAEKAAQSVSREHWAALCPELGIERAAPVPAEPAPPDPAVLESFRHLRYCATAPVADPERCDRLARAVETLRQAGWPASFALVYDEPWQLMMEGPARGLAAAMLGGRPLLMTDGAMHHVRAAAHARGWRPHSDGAAIQRRVSVWLALTDATLDNGCIYVIPKTAEIAPAMANFEAGELPFGDAVLLMHHARALPIDAGAMLGWDYDVIHWGAIARSAPTPRISMAFGWVREDSPLLEGEFPPLDPAAGPPPFEDRLRYIADGLGRFQNQDPAMRPFIALAGRILAGEA
jgi:hypothetical protein